MVTSQCPEFSKGLYNFISFCENSTLLDLDHSTVEFCYSMLGPWSTLAFLENEISIDKSKGKIHIRNINETNDRVDYLRTQLKSEGYISRSFSLLKQTYSNLNLHLYWDSHK